MTYEANEDRRGPRHTPRRGTPATPSWRRAKRGKVDGARGASRKHAGAMAIERCLRRRDDERCERRRRGREKRETPATPSWRRATRGKVDGEGSARQRHTSARDARVMRDAVVTTSDVAKIDGAGDTRRDATANGARTQRITAVVTTSDARDVRRRGRRESTRERKWCASDPTCRRNDERSNQRSTAPEEHAEIQPRIA